jgi:hypothetical protein
MARFSAVPERRARFTEEKRLAALTTPQRSTGQLLYRRPSYLEKDTDGFDGERLVVDGNRLVLTEGQEAPRVVDLAAHPEALALVDSIRAPLAGDLSALQRTYSITASGTLSEWRLVLQPRNPAAASLVARVSVSGGSDGPREVLIEQANGDSDRLLIAPAA